VAQCSGFLFVDGKADAVEESEEESQVDGAGDIGTVLEVEGCEGGNYALDVAVRRKEREFGLCCHDQSICEVFAAVCQRQFGSDLKTAGNFMDGISTMRSDWKRSK